MMPCTDTPQPHVLYLALGTNLGDKQSNLLRALDLIGRCVGQVCRISSFMCTEPWGFSSDNAFFNAACMVHTVLTPLQCLERTQQIERQMGRTLKSVDGHYHDRIIDIDLLVYDRLVLSTPQLTLPHPLMMEREFVTRPLSEVMSGEEFARLALFVQHAASASAAHCDARCSALHEPLHRSGDDEAESTSHKRTADNHSF